MLALFPSCEVTYLGRCMGPGGAVAYSANALVVNAFSNRWLRIAASAVSRFLFGWLAWVDRRFRPAAAFESSASLTFVGRRTDHARTPQETLAVIDALAARPHQRPPAPTHR
jgi:hypothetical protein